MALSNCFHGLYASQFIVGNPIATFSMAEFIRRFYNTYVACDVSVKLASAQNRKQQPDEHVEQYLVDKFLLCDSAKITGLIRYTMAHDGLLPELSLKVQEEETGTMAVLSDNELLSRAKHLEEIAERKRTLEGQARPSTSRNVRAMPARKEGEGKPDEGGNGELTIQSLSEKLDRLLDDKRRHAREGGYCVATCDNCGKPGHIARRCHQPRDPKHVAANQAKREAARAAREQGNGRALRQSQPLASGQQQPNDETMPQADASQGTKRDAQGQPVRKAAQ